MSVDLASINVQSGVNDKGEGFCTIVATSTAGDILLGQLTPGEVRKLALDYLEAAEAAETDGIIYRLLKDKFDLSFEVIGAFISDMRDERSD